MKRLFLCAALAVLVPAALACRSTTGPSRFITGTVRTLDGHPVFYAKVTAGGL